MKRLSKDQNGEDWEIRWGVLDAEEVLKSEFGASGPLTTRRETVIFQDPLYDEETKTLHVYEDAEGVVIAMSEITPSVYAVGVKL